MRRILSPLLAIVLAAGVFAGCGDEPQPIDPGTNNNNNNNTVDPCTVAHDPTVGANGFIINGDGFTNEKVVLDPSGDNFIAVLAGGKSIFTTSSNVTMSDGEAASIVVRLTFSGVAANTYPWDNASSDLGDVGVRVEITKGTKIKIYEGVEGKLMLDSTFTSTKVAGRFCGKLKDSATSKEVTIKSGAFAISNDPTLPIDPCSITPDFAVGKNGFKLSGSGYVSQIVTFETSTRGINYDFETNHIIYTLIDTVRLIDGSDTYVKMALDLPVPDANVQATDPPVTEIWGVDGIDATARIELTRNGSTKVYKSVVGNTKIMTFFGGANLSGTMCGTLKDSLSNARIAIVGGRYSQND